MQLSNSFWVSMSEINRTYDLKDYDPEDVPQYQTKHQNYAIFHKSLSQGPECLIEVDDMFDVFLMLKIQLCAHLIMPDFLCRNQVRDTPTRKFEEADHFILQSMHYQWTASSVS